MSCEFSLAGTTVPDVVVALVSAEGLPEQDVGRKIRRVKRELLSKGIGTIPQLLQAVQRSETVMAKILGRRILTKLQGTIRKQLSHPHASPYKTWLSEKAAKDRVRKQLRQEESFCERLEVQQKMRAAERKKIKNLEAVESFHRNKALQKELNSTKETLHRKALERRPPFDLTPHVDEWCVEDDYPYVL
eukprot:TRINITY_DN30957_c0_g1_i1.p1 TRINITY_DN30957_c0_g1~~TRINITY_DN30957_c0_g1_i1.p1  ORF type:complete len:189 (+),score=30.09 TRINITY_DN30957_c0_g1_i1:57-623(+)